MSETPSDHQPDQDGSPATDPSGDLGWQKLASDSQQWPADHEGLQRLKGHVDRLLGEKGLAADVSITQGGAVADQNDAEKSPTEPPLSVEGWNTVGGLSVDTDLINRSNEHEDIFGDDDDEPPYVSPLESIDPNLASKLAALTNDSNVREVRSLEKKVAENYSDYADGKPDETWSQIVAVRKLLGIDGDHAEQQLLEKSPETIQALSKQIEKFTELIEEASEKDRKTVAWNLSLIMVPFAGAYDEKLFDDSMVDTIVAYARQSALDQSATRNIGEAIEIAGKSGTSDCIPAYLDYYQELASSSDNDLGFGIYRTRSSHLRNYLVSHGLDEQRVQGFRQNVFPLIEQGDSEAKDIGVVNSWTIEYERFGISDFTIHCLVSEVNPKNTRDLIQAYREVPTSDFAKFEQNRKDAVELMHILWGGRDWIHDEVPGVHNVVAAMLDYYETQDNEDVRQEKQAAILESIAKIPNDYQQIIGDYCFDLNNYEKPVRKLIGETYPASFSFSKETEPAINVLRRLVENTRQTTLEKPHTEDEQLNALLEQLQVHPDERTGEVYVRWGQVGQLVAYTNGLLQTRQGELGMRPSMVRALAYIDKMATYAMRGVSDKDWRELPYDSDFKEIVKFRELTSGSDKFDAQSFEVFWKHFTRIPDWPDDVPKAYKKLSERILGQLNKMARVYQSNQYTSYMSGSLWSGNLSHELIGLIDPRSR